MTQNSDHRLADREARRNKAKRQISKSAYKGADGSKDAMVREGDVKMLHEAGCQ